MGVRGGVDVVPPSCRRPRASRPLAFHTTGAAPHMAIEERRKYVTGTCDAPRRVSIAASTCHRNRALVTP